MPFHLRTDVAIPRGVDPELHEIRWDLPLLPFTSSAVTSPAAHPSALPGTS
jgi:muconolactone delta-isomerase